MLEHLFGIYWRGDGNFKLEHLSGIYWKGDGNFKLEHLSGIYWKRDGNFKLKNRDLKISFNFQRSDKEEDYKSIMNIYY